MGCGSGADSGHDAPPARGRSPPSPVLCARLSARVAHSGVVTPPALRRASLAAQGSTRWLHFPAMTITALPLLRNAVQFLLVEVPHSGVTLAGYVERKTPGLGSPGRERLAGSSLVRGGRLLSLSDPPAWPHRPGRRSRADPSRLAVSSRVAPRAAPRRLAPAAAAPRSSRGAACGRIVGSRSVPVMSIGVGMDPMVKCFGLALIR